MVYLSDEEIAVMVDLHGKWLRKEKGGKQADFRNADLAYRDFTGMNLAMALFQNADLYESHFDRANLNGARFDKAILSACTFNGANLTNAELSGAGLTGTALTGAIMHGVNIAKQTIPVVPDIDAKIRDVVERGEGFLEMDEWHVCETTHCRAGWAIHFAGKEGFALEHAIGSSAAGALIYHASCPTLPIPDFFTDNETAYSDICERAGNGC